MAALSSYSGQRPVQALAFQAGDRSCAGLLLEDGSFRYFDLEDAGAAKALSGPAEAVFLHGGRSYAALEGGDVVELVPAGHYLSSAAFADGAWEGAARLVGDPGRCSDLSSLFVLRPDGVASLTLSGATVADAKA